MANDDLVAIFLLGWATPPGARAHSFPQKSWHTSGYIEEPVTIVLISSFSAARRVGDRIYETYSAVVSITYSAADDTLVIDIHKLDQKTLASFADHVAKGINYAEWAICFRSRVEDYKEEFDYAISMIQKHVNRANKLFSSLVELYARIGHEVLIVVTK